MKKNKTLIVAFLATLTLLASCSKEEEIALAPLRIYLQLPMTLDNATLDHAQATLVNIETMASYSIDNFEQDYFHHDHNHNEEADSCEYKEKDKYKETPNNHS